MLKKKLQLCLSGTRKGRANLNLSVMKKEHGHCVDLIMYTVPYLLINFREKSTYILSIFYMAWIDITRANLKFYGRSQLTMVLF